MHHKLKAEFSFGNKKVHLSPVILKVHSASQKKTEVHFSSTDFYRRMEELNIHLMLVGFLSNERELSFFPLPLTPVIIKPELSDTINLFKISTVSGNIKLLN